MNTTEFNLNGLKNIYNESLKRKEPTMVFEIKQGKGLFTFLMFFSDDDIESKDKLFLFLRRTNTLITFKLYGSHRNGDFKIYIDKRKKEQIIEELDIVKSDNTFNFLNFLNSLNSSIPHELSLNEKIIKFREVWQSLKNKNEMSNILDQSDGTILCGVVRLPQNKSPREKTLRKSYLFINAESSTISDLINNLKSKNITLAWTNDEKQKGKSIADILIQCNKKITPKQTI